MRVPSAGLIVCCLPRRVRMLCAWTLGLAASWAQAQSVAELYETARSYDATYLAARAQADSSRFRVEQVRALRRPELSASLALSRVSNDVPYSESTSRGPVVALSARQPLFSAANNATVAQADLQLDSATADLEAAEQSLIVRVAQTYFEALAAQDTLATSRAGKAAIAGQLASAQRNFEVGTATITDTREAQARFDLATAQEIAADNDLRIKQLALDQLVGRSGVLPLALAMPLQLPALEPANVDAWVAQNDLSPSVRRASLVYEVARLESTKARASALPTLDLEGTYQRGNNKVDGTQGLLPYRYSGPTTQSSIGINLRVPLFAGFAVQNRLKEALALEEQARHNFEAARRSADQATRQAFFGVQSGLAQVKALEAAESSSQLSLDATQLGYQVGVRVNVDVLNAQTQLYTTRRDLARARYEVLVGTLRLRQATGRLAPSDILSLNALLAK